MMPVPKFKSKGTKKAVDKIYICQTNKRICTTIHRYPNFCMRNSVMCKVYTGYCGTSEIKHGLCACTIFNPLAKARGLSLRTGAQSMLYLSLVSSKLYNTENSKTWGQILLIQTRRLITIYLDLLCWKNSTSCIYLFWVLKCILAAAWNRLPYSVREQIGKELCSIKLKILKEINWSSLQKFFKLQTEFLVYSL